MKRVPETTAEQKQAEPWYVLPDAGSYSDEECFNGDTDRFDKRKLKIICRKCKRKFAPLCSSHTTIDESEMRWVGCDHKEPYSTARTRCTLCRKRIAFTIYSPQ